MFHSTIPDVTSLIDRNSIENVMKRYIIEFYQFRNLQRTTAMPWTMPLKRRGLQGM